MKSIKYFIQFIKDTKKYRSESIVYLMIHNQLIKRAKWYVKSMKMTDKMIKKYGSEKTYCMMNRTIQF